MNREMRRQQAQLKQSTRGGGRPPSIRPPAGTGSGGGRGGSTARGSFLRPNWIREILSELRKVQWPTRAEAWNLTLVVILVSVVVGITLGGLDSGFGYVLEHTIFK